MSQLSEKYRVILDYLYENKNSWKTTGLIMEEIGELILNKNELINTLESLEEMKIITSIDTETKIIWSINRKGKKLYKQKEGIHTM